jgi:hypothetical protein
VLEQQLAVLVVHPVVEGAGELVDVGDDVRGQLRQHAQGDGAGRRVAVEDVEAGEAAGGVAQPLHAHPLGHRTEADLAHAVLDLAGERIGAVGRDQVDGADGGEVVEERAAAQDQGLDVGAVLLAQPLEEAQQHDRGSGARRFVGDGEEPQFVHRHGGRMIRNPQAECVRGRGTS